jgi:hypothetical protein
MLYLTVYDDNNNNTFNGKYWAIVGTKLSGPPWIRISEGPVFIIPGLKKPFIVYYEIPSFN